MHRAAAGVTIAMLAVLALAADQFTKFLALTNLREGAWVDVIGQALRFTLVFNPGAAFSLGESVTWIFTIALALVACTIVWLGLTRVRSRLWAVVLGLLLGGVLGNLTDRVFRSPGFPVGEVVDFLNTPWMLPAIYNVADIFIVGSMISLALLVVVGLRMDGTRERDHQPVKNAAAADAMVIGELDADDRYESRSEKRARLRAGAEADASRSAAVDRNGSDATADGANQVGDTPAKA